MPHDNEAEDDQQMTVGQAAALQHAQEMREQDGRDLLVEDSGAGNDLGDPDPPPTNASAEMKLTYSRAVKQYSDEMLECLKGTGATGRELWIEFTCTFRESTLKHMQTAQQVAWARFLRDNGVMVEQKRGLARWKALSNCLKANDFIPTKTRCTQTDEANELKATVRTQDVGVPRSQPRAPETGKANNTAKLNGNRYLDHAKSHDLNERTQCVKASSNLCDSPVRDIGKGTGYSKKNGIESLMKAYTSRSKFSGSFTEDFDGAIEQYETLAALCDLTDGEMSKGFPIMLTGSAFSHYTRAYAKQNLPYSDLVDAFRSWYTSEEQRYRLLQTWQRPSLLRAMEEHPEKSELEIFREVSDQLTKVQHQLHKDYHEPRFLRDQLLIAADLPHLRRSLIEKIPATAQEAMQRIATLLSSEPRSAGANCTWENMDEVHYGLGMRYGGNARKNLKGASARKDRRSVRRVLASIKGCWVCKKKHRARDHHSSEEIITALNRIKKETPAVMFSVEDIDDIQSVYLSMHEEENDDDSASQESESDEVNFIAMTDEQRMGRAHEAFLANTSFLHGRSFESNLSKDMAKMSSALSCGESARFQGVILDTGANRRSAMCLEQYRTYCKEFMVPMEIDYNDNNCLLGIGGMSGAVGTASIPIPFVDLGIVIDVKFKILRDSCPNLLSLRDMIVNKLDISIQDKTVSFRHKIQSLLFENDFLKHKWSPEDMSYALYTDKELRRLHRVFGHPTVAALKKLLRNANPDEYSTDVKESIAEITRSCNTCSRLASKPRRFKLSIGTDDLRFNHVLAIDIMTLAGKSVFHAVDEATHYN